MPLVNIDVAPLSGQPLFMRRTIISSEMAEGDYIVVCADMTVARIVMTPKSFGRSAWDWHITGPVVPPEMGALSGSADNLDDAKSAVRRLFDVWLVWASASPERAAWHG